MIRKDLELDRFRLVCTKEEWKLDVAAVASFKVPEKLSNLSQDVHLQALNSRNVWVSRGTGFQIDLEITVDGVLLQQHRLALTFQGVETALLVNPPGDKREQAAWLGGSINSKPPDSVVCLELERLHVRLDFLQTQRMPPKIEDSASAKGDSFTEMFFDIPGKSNAFQTSHIELFESAVEKLKALPDQIANPFRFISVTASETRLRTLNKYVESNQKGSIARNRISGKISVAANPKDRNGKFSMKVKDEMLLDIEVQYGKVEETDAVEDVEMLLDVDYRNKNTVVLSERAEEAEDDEMLFSQSSSSTSTSSSAWASNSSSTSLAPLFSCQQTNVSEPASQLSILAASNLVETSIYTLLGGYIGPRALALRDIELRKTPPSLSLCHLIPALFCPRFKESIAQNTRFLSSVSHVVSVSWPAHVQTPSLRRKLLRLSDLDPSPFLAYPIRRGGSSTSDRLSAVVQSRLWAMMQKKVYDKSGGRTLWRQATEVMTGRSDDEENYSLEEKVTWLEEYERKMETVDPDELLFTDDDEDDDVLMHDRDEDGWERRAIESETNEMLFGSEQADDGDVLLTRGPDILAGGQRDDVDMLLLSDESERDSMLL
ncbi:unnamed protein product [Diplocarpon coronariae]